MAGLGDVLRGLAARDGVQAALLLSGEGLPIDHAARGGVRTGDGGRAGGHTGAVRRPAGRRRRARASCRPPCSTSPAARWCSPAPARGLARRPRPARRRHRSPALRPAAARPALAGSCEPSMRWAVLLAGGSGTRFWPLSTPENPKQLLPLAGSELERGGRGRAARRADPARAHPRRGRRRPGRAAAGPAQASRGEYAGRAARGLHRSRAHLGHLGSAAARSRGGGALAPRRLGGGRRRGVPPTADMALATARRHDRLVTVGMVPSRPETGYGYIVPGPAARRGGAQRRPVLREARRRDRARPDGGGRALEQRALRLDRRAAAGGGRRAHAGGGPACCPRSPPATSSGSSARWSRSPSTSDCWSGAARSRWCAASSPGTTSAPGRRWPGCGPRTPAATSWSARRSCTRARTAWSGPIAIRSSSTACRSWWWCRPTAGSW